MWGIPHRLDIFLFALSLLNNSTDLGEFFVGQDQLDPQVKEGVIQGLYSLVYISPESMLTNLKYREMFCSDVYQHNLMCLVIDKAHCAEKWWIYTKVFNFYHCCTVVL